ncbi:MAG: TetR/AcrR family transcriptional regulator, partial [Gemmatimonadota bacterium]
MPYRQTPRSVRIRARSRNRILRAARRLLARNGLEGTTMNQIASDANTSIGNLYFYFKNKDALLEAVVMAELASHGRRVDRRLEGIPAGPLGACPGNGVRPRAGVSHLCRVGTTTRLSRATARR